jgi:hypothetical protein
MYEKRELHMIGREETKTEEELRKEGWMMIEKEKSGLSADTFIHPGDDGVWYRTEEDSFSYMPMEP